MSGSSSAEYWNNGERINLPASSEWRRDKRSGTQDGSTSSTESWRSWICSRWRSGLVFVSPVSQTRPLAI